MRAYLNAVLLPDATVLVVGGAMSERIPGIDGNDFGGEDIYRIAAAERYHPDTRSWEVLSFPTEYEPIARVYHSVALLLPDGRVWIAGSNHDGARNVHGTRADGKGDARELRMELYSPPISSQRMPREPTFWTPMASPSRQCGPRSGGRELAAPTARSSPLR